MPIPSPQVAEAANRILGPTSNDAQRHYFLTNNAVSPPHGDTSKWRLKAASGIPLQGSTFSEMLDKTEKEKAALAPLGKMVTDDRTYEVGFFKFKAVQNNTEGQIGSITFEIKYGDELTTTASRQGYVPGWFLPWKSGHMLRMKLPAKGTAVTMSDGSPLPNPDLFFTAAINGCSVFVYGDPSTPTVVHGGIGYNFDQVLDNTTLTSLGGDGAGVWRNLLNGVTVNPDGTIRINPPKVRANLGEVNQYDYVRQIKNGRVDQSTAKSEEIENYFKTQRKDQLSGVMVNPWGCVFGVRSASGQWRFILQRNMSVTYSQVFREKRTFGKDRVRYGPVSQTAINVGYEQFFPGGGEISFNSLSSLQVF